MNENDDSKISKLLKASPPLKPPESFYKGVLEKIKTKGQRDQGTERNTLFPFIPPSLRLSVRVLATACVLMVIVLATRESKKSEPGLFQQKLKEENEIGTSNNYPVSGQSIPALKKSAALDHAERRAELQSRMDRSLSKMVGHPSPFEELDKEELKTMPASDAWTKQARDITEGAAAQGSFLQEQGIRAKASLNAPQAAPPASPAAAARRATSAVGFAGGYGAGVGGARNDVTEWQGQRSPITSPQNVVITTREEWQALWPGQIAPDVDFEKNMVVGVFLGTRPSTGYSVRISGIKTLSDKLQVMCREISPPPDALYAQVLTQPYCLKVVSKTSLPVTFEKLP